MSDSDPQPWIICCKTCFSALSTQLFKNQKGYSEMQTVKIFLSHAVVDEISNSNHIQSHDNNNL